MLRQWKIKNGLKLIITKHKILKKNLIIKVGSFTNI